MAASAARLEITAADGLSSAEPLPTGRDLFGASSNPASDSHKDFGNFYRCPLLSGVNFVPWVPKDLAERNQKQVWANGTINTTQASGVLGGTFLKTPVISPLSPVDNYIFITNSSAPSTSEHKDPELKSIFT